MISLTPSIVALHLLLQDLPDKLHSTQISIFQNEE